MYTFLCVIGTQHFTNNSPLMVSYLVDTTHSLTHFTNDGSETLAAQLEETDKFGCNGVNLLPATEEVVLEFPRPPDNPVIPEDTRLLLNTGCSISGIEGLLSLQEERSFNTPNIFVALGMSSVAAVMGACGGFALVL